MTFATVFTKKFSSKFAKITKDLTVVVDLWDFSKTFYKNSWKPE